MSINIASVLKATKVADGAWGTELDKLGCPPGYCREEWNLSHPDLVGKVAASYVQAGSGVILSNTFSANKFTLEKHGLGDKVEALNEAGRGSASRRLARRRGSWRRWGRRARC